MNPCSKYKNWILTDYIDNRLSSSQVKEMESHLTKCLSCRKLLEDIKSEFLKPLQSITPSPVPEDLWFQIKDKIQIQSQPKNFFKEYLLLLKEQWNKGFAIPALALGMFFCLLSLSAVMLLGEKRNSEYKKNLTQETVSYVLSVMDSSSIEEDVNDYGTALERFFL